MSKLTNAEKDKLDNTCGNLRTTKLGTHVKSLEDFVNQGQLATHAEDVTAAINELYGMIVNNDCANIQIPPPGFFTLFGDDETGKLYVYYNDEEHPPLFRHVETPGELEGTLYLYIADPEGENHYEMEIGHYIAVRHLDDYYTKTQSNSRFGVTVEKKSTATSGYAATYVVKQNGSQVGTKIDIPKDFFLKGGSVKTCSTANTPVIGYNVGDKYFDMEINVNDGSETTKHMYILCQDLCPVYNADESTITLSNENVFSVKNGGITMTKLSTAVQNTINAKEDKSNKVTGLSAQSTDTQYPSAKCVFDALAQKSDEGSIKFQRVNILIDKPNGTVDNTLYYLTQDYQNYESGFYVWDDNEYIPLSSRDKEDKSNKVISLSAQSTNTQYPSAKLLYDLLALKQDISSAFSGNYNDLTNKPTNLSDFVNDLDFEGLEVVDNFPTTDVPDNQLSQYEGIIYYLTQDDNNSAYGNFTKGFYVFDRNIRTFVKFPRDVSGKENISNKVISLSAQSTDIQYPSAKLLFDQLALKQNIASAFSGNYNDLTNKPTIPSKTSDLNNDSGFLTAHQDITGKEDKSNKVTSINSSSTDNQYPSAKLLFDQLALKQNISSAFSGNYNDLTNKPTIPSKTSDLNNDSGFINQHQDISGKEDTSNKVTSWSGTPTDAHYPSEKLVKDDLNSLTSAVNGKLNDIEFIDGVQEIDSNGIYILREFTIITEDLTMTAGDGSTFDAYVLDKYGNPYAEGENVHFNLSGVDIFRTIDNNGKVSLAINLAASPDPYTITTTFGSQTNTNTIIVGA